MERARGRVLTWLGGGIDPTGPAAVPRCAFMGWEYTDGVAECGRMGTVPAQLPTSLRMLTLRVVVSLLCLRYPSSNG